MKLCLDALPSILFSPLFFISPKAGVGKSNVGTSQGLCKMKRLLRVIVFLGAGNIVKSFYLLYYVKEPASLVWEREYQNRLIHFGSLFMKIRLIFLFFFVTYMKF